jgi:hypothetical protein
LAAAAHLAMSPAALPWWAIPGAFLAVFGSAAVSAGRERGLAPITVAMLASQLVLHLWFQVAQLYTVPSGDCAAMPDMPGMCGSSIPTHSGSAMLVGHVLAASAAAWWLRRGEAAVFAVAARWRSRIVERIHCLLATTSRVQLPASDLTGPPPWPAADKAIQVRVLRFAVARRGPPATPASV